MSVLIKDLKMPTQPMIIILFPDGKIATEDWDIGANAKAIELQPHGRLIDADALIGKLHDTYLFDYDARAVVYKEIEDAPTIIEEESEA